VHAERPLLALAFRVAGIALISTMFMLVKYAAQSGIALPEIMFWRQAVSLPMLAGWLAVSGALGQLRTRRLASHARRAVLGMTGMLCGFAASILLPLAEATTLGFTTPLFAVILTALVFREHVGPWRWMAVILGFAGVLIIAQPGHAPIATLGTAAGLGSGFAVALVSFQIRDLGRTEASAAIVFYFALFGTLMTAPFLPFYVTSHSPGQWLILIGLGAFGTLGQLLLTTALRRGAVASVIVMDYTSLIWATLYGWLIWQQLPPLATWLGAPAIVAEGLFVALREQRLAKTISPPTSLEVD
jgi:drug/metabolite transporter (DMT)-like permease